jgi:hypothetical protein
MKVDGSAEILDPYDWLPEHGENSVKIRMEGTDLIVTIMFDGVTGASERELRFSYVCSFYVQAFPGPSMLGPDVGEVAPLLRGALVEYPQSEAATAWKRHFSDTREVRHFSVAFLAENLLLVVLAGGVCL